jgi:hypothetical protein
VTHTYAVLEISSAAYEEIKEKLKAAGYQHAFQSSGEIDMHGIAVAAKAESGFQRWRDRYKRKGTKQEQERVT